MHKDTQPLMVCGCVQSSISDKGVLGLSNLMHLEYVFTHFSHAKLLK